MENKRRILIADASDEFRKLLCDAVAGESDLEVAGDGRRTGGPSSGAELTPEAVVMDLVLRNEDGLAVLRELGELEIHPRVLVLSGFARSNMAELAAAAGADYCLMKPCRMDTVVERVRQMTAGYMDGEERSGWERGLESVVTAIIHEIGVPAHIKGYQYLREAIIIAVEDMDVINAVTKVLYPEVAKRFGTTASRVGAGHPPCHRGSMGPGRS